MKFSVVIVNYKSKESIFRCVDSIFANFGKETDWEIVIINNDHWDSLKELEKRQRIKITNLFHNVGFGSAANKGAEEAQGELLLFLNPDAEVASSRLDLIFNEFESDPNLGIIGSKIVDRHGAVEPWSAGVEVNILNLILNNLGLSRSRKIWESRNKIQADWVSGAAFFVRRELFLKNGGFDEKFFLYFEDMDFCKRIREKSFSVLYLPAFSVRHEGGKSFENKKMQKRHYYDSMEKYFQKHHGKVASITMRFLRKLFLK
jgi:N-acetylglucosaminyl-diphospho-decaprenol L-rhamnosyltransferase